jgi:crossover junction endodeoxyribonuclease RuvC
MNSPSLSILGVDPGLSGAVVLYSPASNEIIAKRDFKSLRDVACAVRDLGRQATFAVMEFVSARPGQGVTSMFHFGQADGAAIGALETIDLPWVDVTPSVWQRWVREYLGLPSNAPFGACEAALQAFSSDHHYLFKRSKDHNTADACFLALYGSIHADMRLKASGGDSQYRRLPPLKELLHLQEQRRYA